MNMIIGKKQIILASLVVGLGLAVYVNYQFAQADGALTSASAAENDKNYGDAQLVDANDPTVDGEAYFAEAKVTRQRTRDEAIETMKNMMTDAAVDANIKAEMVLKATELAKSVETEGKIENLIKAKGFEDCMVYYDTEGVDVVVKTEGLKPEEVAQMKDIILKETSVPVENISIVEIN
ncbi:SpoIIIAH-like family protein [Marasmitruncus massiliensis]|jgi:stage III sporulation protein AH|uniref:SpoIIIAH-like family protein n=1 Tax=Marasmitruncus massiliensis TaxID=1944642 RepID=UPI000C7A1434|nr:SpoIIIAH-like family protein [Marasmitruncus massiliensis]MBE6907072.1 SpoIIIAH-like family protein [Oscillospiraceae bacterium]